LTLLVTGGAGFIGANFVLDWLVTSDEPVMQGDIGHRALVSRLPAEHRPRAVVNFAAESHVDRSIHGLGNFIQTNIVVTFNLIEALRGYWST
jgi:dTDP-glucose 4,6-dehydratase